MMNRRLLINEAEIVTRAELILAIFSGVFVMVYLAIHLRSPLIAVLGMLQIVAAFPITFFIFRMFFQITLFPSVNLLSIFITLGISADDLFVFYDAWR